MKIISNRNKCNYKQKSTFYWKFKIFSIWTFSIIKDTFDDETAKNIFSFFKLLHQALRPEIWKIGSGYC